MYTLITLILISICAILAIKNLRLRKQSAHLSHQFDETALILESLRDGLIECDTQMIPTRVNHAAEEILGLEASSIVNRSIDPNNIANEFDKILSSFLFPPKGADGTSYDIFLSLPQEKKLRVFTIPKTNPGSKVLQGYIKIVRDVTIETVVEQHKSDLVSIVSHQLLTPLTGVKWIFKSMIAGDNGPLNQSQSEMLKRGIVANEDMIGLVTDILDVTKVEQARFSYKMLPYEIVGFIRDMISSRAEKALGRQVRIEEETRLTSKEVTFDKERLSIALGNLLDNSIDYSPAASIITVRLDTDGNNVRIAVIDHGIGIPEKELEYLFSKFYRAENAKRVRTTGTGLGLYLAKHIIEDHGGSIRVSSKENEGSTFTILLPINPTSVALTSRSGV